MEIISRNSYPIPNGGPDRIVRPNEMVFFNGTASVDLDGTIVEYYWDFGDGTDHTGPVNSLTLPVVSWWLTIVSSK